MEKILKYLSYTRLIAGSFLGVIIVGTCLLMLPISGRGGQATPFLQAAFTATSSTCVTGLAVYDTYSHWSTFGQIVIIALIQIGGLGLMTFVCLFSIFMKKRIGLHERKMMMVSSGNMRLSGVIQLVRSIAKITFICEGLGALVLFFAFLPKMGVGKSIYYGIFHGISAFCNAGFDLFGYRQPDSSLATVEQCPEIMLPLAVLIVVGGLGFQVWNDLLQNRHHFKQYSLHTKMVLTTTAILLLGGSFLYLLFEHKGHMANLSVGQQVLSAGFMSVTTRTAGFAGFDLTRLSVSGSLLTMILMLIGGSPGSTAGGMKTTTLAVLVLSMIGMAKGESDITVYKRRLNKDLIKHAAVIFFVYVSTVCCATMFICALEPVSLQTVLFETCSALGTAGLTQGLSGMASAPTLCILMLLMYGGRIGGLSLLLVFAERKTEPATKRPAERLML